MVPYTCIYYAPPHNERIEIQVVALDVKSAAVSALLRLVQSLERSPKPLDEFVSVAVRTSDATEHGVVLRIRSVTDRDAPYAVEIIWP